MSHQDRGPYAPADRLAFDPRVPVRSGPAPVTLVASALILVGLIGGVAFVYRHGFRHPGAAPAEVGAPIAEPRAPAAPSQAAPSQVSGAPAALSIGKTNAIAPTFAPPPETPAPRSPAPAPPAAPAAAAPKVVITSLPPATTAPRAVAASAPPPAPPAQAAPRVVATSAAPAPTAPKTAAASATTPTPAKVRPAKPITIASLADAAVAGRSSPARVAAPAPGPMVDTTAAKPSAGAGWVQIGAFSSAALADKGWSDIAALAPEAMAGKGRKFQPVQAGGKTLYRAFITGFPSHAAAQAFCDKLKAAGKSCFVK